MRTHHRHESLWLTIDFWAEQETVPCVRALDSYVCPDGDVEVCFDLDIEPDDPGVLTGPYEDSYPPSDGAIDVMAAWVQQDGKKVKLPDALCRDLADHLWEQIETKAREQYAWEPGDDSDWSPEMEMDRDD